MTLLIIPDEVTSQAYTVTTAQTVFPFTFAVFSKTDIHFSVAGTELAQTDFTLSGTVLDGGGYQGGTVTLNVAVSACACLMWRETSPARTLNFSPAPSVPVRDIDVSLNKLSAAVMDIKRDLATGGLAVGASGVASVNGKTGIVTLAAADVGCVPITGGTYTGVVSGLTATPGDNTTKLATTAFVTAAIGAGGGVTLATTGTPANDSVAALGVGTHAAREDHVHNLPSLTALGASPAILTTKGDLFTFGAAPLRLPVGANAQIVVADSTQTSGLRWANLDWSIVLGRPTTFPPSAHTHVYTDVTNFGNGVNASLAAGAGVTLSLSGGITTVTAAGSLAYQYVPAWENGVTTGNAAATNVTNLQSLINTLNASGGGTIWFNAPGAYQINSTITLKSSVGFRMAGGAYFSWTGAAGGTVFQSDSANVLYSADLEIAVNEGGSFTGTVFNLHSAYNCVLRLTGLGTQTSAGTFVSMFADSSAGLPPWSGLFQNRNTCGNQFYLRHMATCGTGLLISGITSGYAGQPQGVTNNNFHNTQFANVLFRGIKISQWADTNTFSGNTYVGLVGSGSIGVMVNEGRVNNYTVYNIHFEHLAVDSFAGTGPNRTGVVLFESKMMFCDEYFNDPEAENGHFIGTSCLSYRWMTCTPATNNIYMHEKGFSRGL